jgi:hypothetical protein
VASSGAAIVAAAGAVAAVVSAVTAVAAVRWARISAVAARTSARAAEATADAAAAQASAATRSAASDELIAELHRENAAYIRAERAARMPPEMDTRPHWGLINGRVIGRVSNTGTSRLILESAELDDGQFGRLNGYWRKERPTGVLMPGDSAVLEFRWTDPGAATDRRMAVTVAFRSIDDSYRAHVRITLSPVPSDYDYPQWEGTLERTEELFERPQPSAPE